MQIQALRLAILGGIVSFGTSGHAFKTGTHAATANETVDQLEFSLAPDGTGTLEFDVNGRRLSVSIDQGAAFQAVKDHPEFFAAGVIGPDAFPDPLTGQIMMHGDESEVIKDLIKSISNTEIPQHPHADPFESREGPAEFRSIDFATAMLVFLEQYSGGFFSPAPKGSEQYQQIVAFIMGYISHGVGDGFAHTWVNEIAGGAWSLTSGQGLFGSFSEEIKHIAIETMVDKLVPDEYKSVDGDGGGYERIMLRAPVQFLDAFYASRAAHSPVPSFDPEDSSVADFIDHYSNLNVYHGGFFYNYLNAQTQVAGTLKAWSGFGGFFDLAEDVNENQYVNFGLDLAQLPEDVNSWLANVPNPVGWLPELTGGFVDCHAEKFGNPLPTPITDLREALAFVGGINPRIETFSTKARVIRHNWIKLSQCTSENMARSGAADFDPNNPQFNRDSCADIVRAGWVDEGNENGLYRADIRPRGGVAGIEYFDLNQDERFLLDLKAAFLGEDAEDLFLLVDDPINNHAVWEFDEAVEGENGHRSLDNNLSRMLDYIVDFAFRGDELDEVIFPDDGGSIKDDYNDLCSAARDPAFENCLDIAFAPIAAAGRSVVCAAEAAECLADHTATCLGSICEDSCGSILSNSQCADMCGTGEVSGCKGFCDDAFCVEICVPVLGCGDVCEPVTHTTCNLVCDIFNDDDRADSCAAQALESGLCPVAHIECEINNLIDTITLENYAEELLTPVRTFCDVVDEAVDLLVCLEGDPNLPQAQQEANRRNCIINLCATQSGQAGTPSLSIAQCTDMYDGLVAAYDDAVRVKDAIGAVADALRDRPAHEIVNLAFLMEDMQRSPEYLTAVQDAVNDTANAWINNPPPPGAPQDEVDTYNRRGDAINRWQTLIADVQALGSSADPIGDFTVAAEDAAQLIEDSNALGLIPTVIGPTAQDIYGDIGPVFDSTFLPFYNTVQGMKLAPMHRDDIQAMFEAEAPGSTELLPWNQSPNRMSSACRGDATNMYCDVLLSNDDPNCLNCSEASLMPDPSRFGWVPGRGIVAFNEYDPTNPVRHVTTAFPVSNSDESYESLYTRIFKVPAAAPSFAGFDDPDSMWTSDQLDLSINNDNFTEGSGSLSIDDCGWGKLDSPRFSTAEWGVIGDELKVDVYIPGGQDNEYWIGDAQFFVTVPGTAVINQPLNWIGLTDLDRPDWSTLNWTVPQNIQDVLLGDYANAQFSIQINYSGCSADPILLDNLRFDGELREREIFHLRGSQTYDVATNDLFSFDHPSDWSASVPISGNSELRVEGSGSLAVEAGGYVPVVSRQFSTSEISSVTPNLSIDVYLPEPQMNPYWAGSVQMVMVCGWTYFDLGAQSLTNRFEDEFNTLEYTLSDLAVDALNSDRSDCEMRVILNTTPSGVLLLDNMGFH